MIRDIKRVQDKVAHILEKHPKTRDCDKTLWLGYLVLFHDLRNILGDEAYQRLRHLILSNETPTMESIRRVRQKFQEGGKFLGEKKIKQAREVEENRVREWAKQ